MDEICDCDSDLETWARHCPIHVDCDARCKALETPVTMEDFRAALKHWIEHGCLHGCSHGC